ncbi:hypothetical protein H6X63_08025 [Luteimonas sp. MC1825]|nr:hypothetical protein [Luteimonas sp. MC1825]QOC87285.1 hypothetical protein IDM46_08315 [Luteimonas sp. MC1825]
MRMIALLVAMSVAAGCVGVPGPVTGDRSVREAVQRPISDAWPRTLVRAKQRSAGGAPVPAVRAFEYAYAPPDSPGLQQIHVRVRDADLLHRLPEVQAMDGLFVLPRRLRYVTAECGEFGAFYRPAETEVVLCYETLRTLYERGLEQQQRGGLDDGYPLRYVRANIRFIVLHETGHALAHLLDLPVTGRQEDAMDQLAAILMLRFADLDETSAQVIGNLRMAADWLLSRSTGAYNLHAYADEHALGEQRYFNLQCLIYGTDPAAFADMVDAGDLTPARAQGCPRETRMATRAWLRLLLPHLAPDFELYEDEAQRYLQHQW